MAVDAGKVIATLELDTSQFQGGINSAKTMLNTWRDAGSTLQDKLKATSAMLGDIGRTLTTTVTLPLVAAGTAAVKTFATFDDSMRQVRATMGLVDETNEKTAKDIQLLTDTAQKMGAQTRYSASEAASALNYLALAGYNAEQACNALPTVLRLAQAGGLDLAYASNLATNSMNALGLSMDKLPGFADQLAVTSQRSGTNVSELGEAILTVGATAKNLAGGTAELNAELGILADAGSKGAEGGTRLRNVLMSLQSPTEEGAKALKKYTQGVYDAQGNLRSLDDILGELKKSMASMTQEEQMSVLDAIFNKTDLAAAQVLIKGAGERFHELTGYITESSGAAENMAEVMEGGIGGSFRSLGSAVEGLAIEFGENLAPSVQGVTDFVTDLTRGFAALDEGTQSTIMTIAGIAAVVGPAALAISKITTAIMSTNPYVAAAVVGITALIAVISKLKEYGDWGAKIDQQFGLGISKEELENQYKIDSIDLGEIEADYKLKLQSQGQTIYELIAQIMNDGLPEGEEERKQMADPVNAMLDDIVKAIEDHYQAKKEQLQQMYASGLITKDELESQTKALEEAKTTQQTALTDAAADVTSYIDTLIASNRAMTDTELAHLQELINKFVELGTQAETAQAGIEQGMKNAYTRVVGGYAVEGDVERAASYVEMQYHSRQDALDAAYQAFKDSEQGADAEALAAYEAAYQKQAAEYEAQRNAAYGQMIMSTGFGTNKYGWTEEETLEKWLRAAELGQALQYEDEAKSLKWSGLGIVGNQDDMAKRQTLQAQANAIYAKYGYDKYKNPYDAVSGDLNELQFVLNDLGVGAYKDIVGYWAANGKNPLDMSSSYDVLNAAYMLAGAYNETKPEYINAMRAAYSRQVTSGRQAAYESWPEPHEWWAEETERGTAARYEPKEPEQHEWWAEETLPPAAAGTSPYRGGMEPHEWEPWKTEHGTALVADDGTSLLSHGTALFFAEARKPAETAYETLIETAEEARTALADVNGEIVKMAQDNGVSTGEELLDISAGIQALGDSAETTLADLFDPKAIADMDASILAEVETTRDAMLGMVDNGSAYYQAGYTNGQQYISGWNAGVGGGLNVPSVYGATPSGGNNYKPTAGVTMQNIAKGLGGYVTSMLRGKGK